MERGKKVSHKALEKRLERLGKRKLRLEQKQLLLMAAEIFTK
jgi:hypothetical protein